MDFREIGLMMGNSRRWVYCEDVLELAEDSAEWRGSYWRF
jgi:hypothetical protein